MPFPGGSFAGSPAMGMYSAPSAGLMGSPPPGGAVAAGAGSKAEMLQMLASELARLQVKVKEKRARAAAAKAAAAAGGEAAMLAKLMAEIQELKAELDEE